MRQFILGSRYYFSRLSDFEKKIYRQIYDCWVTGNSVARVTLPGSEFLLPSGVELHQIVTYIIDENPHLFHLETSHFHYSRIGQLVTIQADNVYGPAEYRHIYARLLAKVDQILELAKVYTTNYDRLRFLHDYLAKNIIYDRGLPDTKSQREIHTIVGALLNNACVCDGYARAYRLLCDQLHLSCIVAIGDSTAMGNAGPHAWNFVKLNHQVYHVDVTWDSCLFYNGCPAFDYYFMRNDAVFLKEHSWDPALYPPILKDYPRKERTITTKWELEQHLCQKIREGERDVLVCFADSFPGAEALQRLLKDIVSRNPGVFAPIRRYGSVYYGDIQYAEIHFE